MFKNILVLSISVIVAYFIVKIIFTLFVLTFKLVSFFFTLIIVAIIALPIYYFATNKLKK
jgi:hypothetical protein